MWSDGDALQFKTKHPFYIADRYSQIAGMSMTWSFFYYKHGKGDPNGFGSIIETTLTHEKLKPNNANLKCVTDAIEFVKQNHSISTPSVYSSRFQVV